jgi:hypothetical protein
MLDLERGNDLGRRQGRQGHLSDDDVGSAHGRDHGFPLGAGDGEGHVNGLGEVGLDPTHPATDHDIPRTTPLQHEGLHGAAADIQAHHPPPAEKVEIHALIGRTTIPDDSNVNCWHPRKIRLERQKRGTGRGG